MFIEIQLRWYPYVYCNCEYNIDMRKVANLYIVILTADRMYENFVALPDNDGDNYRNFEVK